MRNNERIILFLELMLNGVLIFSFGKSALSATGYKGGTLAFLCLALLLSILFKIAFSRFTRFLLVIAASISAFFVYWAMAWKLDLNLLSQKARLFYEWLMNYLNGNIPFDAAFIVPFGVMFFMIIAALVVFSAAYPKIHYIVLFFGVLYFGYLWFSYIEASRFIAMIFLGAGFARLALIKYRNSMKKYSLAGYSPEEGSLRGFVLSVGVMVAVAITIATIIPLSIEPVYWEWLSDTAVQNIPGIVEFKNEFEESRDYGYYSGFENNGKVGNTKRLGDPVKLSDKPVLEVTTAFDGPIYLRGNIYSTYTGDIWSTVSRTEEAYPMGGGLSTSNFLRYEPRKRIELEVKPVGIVTSSVFSPYDTFRVEGPKATVYKDNQGRIYLSKIIPKKSIYRLTGMIPTLGGIYNTDGISPRIRNGEFEYKEISNDSAVGLQDISPLQLEYLALPSNVPDRVRKLAVQIKEEQISFNKEDFFIAGAMTEYLRNSFTYSLSPPERGTDRELVDYFLFDTKQGYCVHFASALTVMLRAVGIPARYVEGYRVEDLEDRTRTVRSRDAHAWVEVYIREFEDWYTFEPTPIMGVGVPTETSRNTVANTGTTGGQVTKNETSGNLNLPISEVTRKSRVDGEEESGGGIIYEKEKSVWKLILQTVLIVLILFCIIVILLRIYNGFLKPKRETYLLRHAYKPNRTKQGLERFIRLIEFYGRYLGVYSTPDQTSSDLRKLILASIADSDKIKEKEERLQVIEAAFHTFEMTKYGGRPLNEDDALLITKCIVYMDLCGIERLGKWKNFRRKMEGKRWIKAK